MTIWLNAKNNAESILASGITAGATSLTVASGEGSKFPSSNFNVTIDDEILLCTTRSGDVLTVTRAQEGTSAAAHSAGASVSLNVTAGIITELQNNIDNHASAITGIHSFNKSCGVYNDDSVIQVMTSGVWYAVPFDHEDWDNDNIHNNAIDNTRLTCKTAGLYIIMTRVGFDYNPTGRRNCAIKLNATTYIASECYMPITDSGLGTPLQASCLRYMNVNDYIETHVKQNSGGNLNLIGTPGNEARFFMARIP